MIRGPQNGQRQVNRGTLANDLSTLLDVLHHNTSKMHRFGEAFDTPGTPSDIAPGVPGNPGQSDIPARSDHTHGTSSSTTGDATFQSTTIPALSAVPITTGIPGYGLATLTILAATYDRILTAYAIILPTAQTVSTNPVDFYLYSYTSTGRTRWAGPSSMNNSVIAHAPPVLLPANTGATVIARLSSVSTAATISTAGGADMQRIDALLVPVH